MIFRNSGKKHARTGGNRRERLWSPFDSGGDGRTGRRAGSKRAHRRRQWQMASLAGRGQRRKTKKALGKKKEKKRKKSHKCNGSFFGTGAPLVFSPFLGFTFLLSAAGCVQLGTNRLNRWEAAAGEEIKKHKFNSSPSHKVKPDLSSLSLSVATYGAHDSRISPRLLDLCGGSIDFGGTFFSTSRDFLSSF